MDLGLFVLRVIVGALLMGHGLQKLRGWWGGPGIEGMASAMESMGMRPGRLHATGAGLAETGGGALIVLGLLTPIGAALIIAVMITASLTAHGGKGIWASGGGFEFPLTNAVAVFALAGAGPGAWSLDNAFALDLAGTGWAIAALAAGLAGALFMMSVGRYESRQQAQRRRRRPPRPAAAGSR